MAKPKSVPHPELVDPDVYWQRSLWPQASAVVKAARALLVEVAAQLQPTVPAAEAEMQAWLNWRAYETQQHRAADPDHVRGLIVDEIAARCEELHHIIEMVGVLRPPLEAIERLQGELDERRRKEAINDLKKSPRRLRASAQRHRYACCASTGRTRSNSGWRLAKPSCAPPCRGVIRTWRSTPIANSGSRSARDIDDMIEDLTRPILEIGQRLVQMYDQLTTVSVS